MTIELVYIYIIILTIEPQPAGPTFARVARYGGAHAGLNGLPMDTNILYIYTREMRQPTRVTGSLRSQLFEALKLIRIIAERLSARLMIAH